ncbi:glycoside hydrolase/deacetylase [Agrocybe pediades]|nr:glycoside hydrolase/deacetylase [Agrocybe pediades]
MIFPSSFVVFLSVACAAAAPKPSEASHSHSYTVRRALPNTWHQPDDHPVHALFKRATATGDGVAYPAVGDAAWAAAYPQSTPDSKALPAAWVNALNAAVAAGTIPDIPIPTQTAPNTNPIYPTGSDPNSPNICSGTYKCRIPGDIWDSPDGVFASSFDDGPSPSTPKLVNFLDSNNVTSTHFNIGVNILQQPNEFQMTFEAGHDIAVHTWTHPYMTTLSNLDVVAQLGWTMQLIHNSTGGRVPRYWRPPYGDSDVRTGAIAKEVFGLETVFWNHDTNDWEATQPDIEAALTQFLATPKTPGLIILEHEIVDRTVDSFIASFPKIAAAGWKFESLAKAVNDGRTYQNAAGSLSNDVKVSGILLGAAAGSSNSSSTTSSTQSGSSTSSTSSSSATSTPGNNLSPNNNNTSEPGSGQKGASIANRDTLFLSKSYLSLVVVSVVTGIFATLL